MKAEDKAVLEALRWVRDNPLDGSVTDLSIEVSEAFYAACLKFPHSLVDYRPRSAGMPQERHLTATGAARLAELEAQECAELQERYASGELPTAGDTIGFAGRTHVVLDVLLGSVGFVHPDGHRACLPPSACTLLSRAQPPAPAMDAVERVRRDGTVVIPSDAHTCNPCNAGTPGACLACDAIGAADDAGIEWRETAPAASPERESRCPHCGARARLRARSGSRAAPTAAPGPGSATRPAARARRRPPLVRGRRPPRTWRCTSAAPGSPSLGARPTPAAGVGSR